MTDSLPNLLELDDQQLVEKFRAITSPILENSKFTQEHSVSQSTNHYCCCGVVECGNFREWNQSIHDKDSQLKLLAAISNAILLKHEIQLQNLNFTLEVTLQECNKKDIEVQEVLFMMQQLKSDLDTLEESRDNLYVTNLKMEKTLLAVSNDLEEANQRARELCLEAEEKAQINEKLRSEIVRVRQSTVKVEEWKEKAVNLQHELDQSRESEAASLTKIRTLKESYNELEEVHEHLLIEHQDLTYEREKYEALSWLRDSNEKLREHVSYLESRMLDQPYDEDEENDAIVSILRELTEENIKLKSEVAEYCELLTETRNEASMLRAKLEDLHFGHLSFDSLNNMYASLDENYTGLTDSFHQANLEHPDYGYAQQNGLEVYCSSAPLTAPCWGQIQEKAGRPLTVPTTPEGSLAMGNTMFGELEKYVQNKRRERRKHRNSRSERDTRLGDTLSVENDSCTDTSDTQSIQSGDNLSESQTSNNTSIKVNAPDNVLSNGKDDGASSDELKLLNSETSLEEGDIFWNDPDVGVKTGELSPILEMSNISDGEAVEPSDYIKPNTVSEGCTNKAISEREPAKKSAKKRRKSKKNKKKMTDDKSESNEAQPELIVSENNEKTQPEASHDDGSHSKKSVESKEITSIDASKEMARDLPNIAISTIELDAVNVKTTPRNIPRSPLKNNLSPSIRAGKLNSVEKEKENPIFISTDDHLSDGSYDSTFISELLQTQKKLSKEVLSSEQSLGGSDVLIKKEECSNVFRNITEPTIRIQKGFLTPQPKTAKLRPDFGRSPRLDRGKDIGLPNLGTLLRRTKGDSFSPSINSDRIDIKNMGGANFKGKNYIRHRVHSEASAHRPPTTLLNVFEKNESFRNSPKSDMDLDVLPEGFATRRARLFRQQRSANVESEIAKKLEWLSATPTLGPKSPHDKRLPISPRSLKYLHAQNGDPERLDTLDNDRIQELKLTSSREAFVKRSYPSVENQSYTLPNSPVYLCQLYEYSTDVIERIRSTEMTGLNRPMRRAFDVNELSKTSNSMLDDIVKEIANMHQYFKVATPHEDSADASKCSKSQSQPIGFQELIKLIQDLLKDMALLRMTSNDYTVAYYRLLDQKRQEATEEAGFSPNNTSSVCRPRLQKTPSRNLRAQIQPALVTQLTPVTGTLISPVSHISGDDNLCTSQLSALISKNSPITPTAPTSEPEIWYNRFGIHRCHGYQHNSHIWCSNSNRLDTDGLYEFRGNPYY